MKEIRTVSKCDHHITSIDSVDDTLTLIPFLAESGGSVKYFVPGNIQVSKIANAKIVLTGGEKRLKEKYDYVFSPDEQSLELLHFEDYFTQDILDETLQEDSKSGIYRKVKLPASYSANWGKLTLHGLFIMENYTEHELLTCPRCHGSGWYVNLFEPNMEAGIWDMQKLTQEVIKALFTDFDGAYGTEIKKLVGKNFRGQDDFVTALQTEVKKAEAQVKARQSAFRSSGGQLEDSELLSKILITKVAYFREEGLYEVWLEIVSAENASVTIETIIN